MDIGEAIKSLLESDGELMETASGVYYGKAPQDGVLPYCIFFKVSGMPIDAFDSVMKNEVWVVKGVGLRKQAKAIRERAYKLLQGTELALTDMINQDVRHIGDVDYDELIKGQRYDHTGYEYRIYYEGNDQ